MGNIENIGLTTSTNLLIILLCVIFLAAYSYYIYRYTLPAISKVGRYLLIVLRAATVALICFLIFEPLLTITKKESIQTKNYIFIDNSKSITVKDSSARANLVKSFIDKFSGDDRFVINTFGQSIREHRSNLSDSIFFNEANTNISKIFTLLNDTEENISSAILLSDGIITEGSDPTYLADKLNIPVFTVGIGDTNITPDILVKDIVYNQFIYKEKPTQVEAILTNYFLENRPAVVSLFEDDRLITTENITISNTGINKVEFNTVLDAFGGSNVIGYFLKCHGKKVITNEIFHRIPTL